MEQNQFRIGATYRNKRGDVVRLSAIDFSPHAQQWGRLCPGHTFAQADRIGDSLGCGYISLRNGQYCSRLGEDSTFHLIPGELTLVNGEWVGFDFKREEEPFGSDHCHQGGDGVTNFDPAQRPIYEEAIRRHGDSRLYIGKPMGNGGLSTDLALRAKDFPASIKGFWEIFDALTDAATKTPTLDKLANTTEPKRPPLDWADDTPFDPFKDFIVTSGTQAQEQSKNTGFPAWRADTAASHLLGGGVKHG